MVESTYNWYWLVDGLQEVKYKVHLANPAAMQQYSGMKYTDDKWDSYWLAHLLRLGILPGGVYLSERDKADTGFIEKANNVGAAQDGARIKPAKHGESQYRKKVESQRCEETKRRRNKQAVIG